MRLITIKKLQLCPSGVAIICVEKLHWQVVSINTEASGENKIPTYHVIW